MVRNVNDNTKRVVKKYNINLDMQEDKLRKDFKDPVTTRSGGNESLSNEIFQSASGSKL